MLNKYHGKLPVLQALIAAVLFGASAPLSKLMLGEIEPVPMAAFLYIGSGTGLVLFRLLQKAGSYNSSKEAKLGTNDIPWLLGAIFSGGVAAPIVLMFSLKATPSATASLLLNFEGVATTVIAAVVFKEALGRKIWGAVAVIAFASIILSWDAKGSWGISAGAAGVLAACILWGIDNNFTRNISAKDPFILVTVKGLGAGTFSLALAFATGSTIPGVKAVVVAMLLGCFSYGASIVLFVFSLRGLGAARASAFFGTAPFIGVGVSFVFFRDISIVPFLIALPIMLFGVVLLLGEAHWHRHEHSAYEHEHRHIHGDGHHDHYYDWNASEDHSHVHRHEALSHAHRHTPDLHHRHAH